MIPFFASLNLCLSVMIPFFGVFGFKNHSWRNYPFGSPHRSLVAAAYTPEMEGLELPTAAMDADPVSYTNKRVFLATDCQGTLTSMNPFKRPKFGHVDSTATLKKMKTSAAKFNQCCHVQWVPSHVNLKPNEEVDAAANDCQQPFDANTQLQRSVHPATLKTVLRQAETRRFQNGLPFSCHTGVRFHCCGIKRSNFHERDTIPRALQTPCSRWRLGQVESCGTHARKLQHVVSPACRFCGFPCKTTAHLLLDCPRTAHMCFLCCNVIAIAEFDAFIRRVLPCDSRPPNQQILSSTLHPDDNPRKQSALLASCSVSELAVKWCCPDRKRHLIPPLHSQPHSPSPKKHTLGTDRGSLQ